MGKYGVNLDETIKRAIKAYDKEKEAEKRKGVLHNTRLLLRHYNDLSEHVEKAIDTIGEIDLSDIDAGEFDKDDLYIMSIKKSKIRTLIMIAHIDMALDQLKKKQKKSHTIEKYKALEMFYIKEIPYDEIVKHFNCGVNTPRRWINQMLDELSILLFGVLGLKDLV